MKNAFFYGLFLLTWLGSCGQQTEYNDSEKLGSSMLAGGLPIEQGSRLLEHVVFIENGASKGFGAVVQTAENPDLVRYILTSASLLAGGQVSELKVFFAGQNSQPVASFCKISKSFRSVSDENQSQFDLAVLELDQACQPPSYVKPAPLLLNNVGVNKKLHVVGLGTSSVFSQKTYTNQSTISLLDYNEVKLNLEPGLFSAQDAGVPVFVSGNGVFSILGILGRQGIQDSQKNGSTTFMSAPAWGSFIESVIQRKLRYAALEEVVCP